MLWSDRVGLFVDVIRVRHGVRARDRRAFGVIERHERDFFLRSIPIGLERRHMPALRHGQGLAQLLAQRPDRAEHAEHGHEECEQTGLHGTGLPYLTGTVTSSEVGRLAETTRASDQ